MSAGESVESSTKFFRSCLLLDQNWPKLTGRLRRGAVCSGGSCSPSAEAPPACKAGEHKGIEPVEIFLKAGDDVMTPVPSKFQREPGAAVHASFFRLIDLVWT